MSDSESEIDINEGIKQIDNQLISNLFNYLRTGSFNNKTKQAYMISYTIVYKLADDEKNSSSILFNYYNTTIINYLKELYVEISSEQDENLIVLFLKATEKSKILINWMRKVFAYLDKFHTKSNKTGTLFFNSLKNYGSHLFFPLKDRLINCVNLLINQHRDGKVVDTMKIVDMIEVFESVDIKNPVLEKVNEKYLWKGIHTNEILKDWFRVFISSTEEYITNKSKTELTYYSVPEYVRSCLKYLSEEDERKRMFIREIFYEKLDMVNTKILVDNQSRQLSKMDTGIQFMFDNKKESELKETFLLFSRSSESLKVITDILNPYIRERGEKIYQNKEIARDPIKFIPELLTLKSEIDALVQNAFLNHMLFQDCKNKSFSIFMNKEHYSKQLANYCDYEFKIGFKGVNESVIEERLNSIISLFKCLNNKMIFQFEYTKKLSDRLINSKSQSIFAEQMMIGKLKVEQGVTFVSKMMSMLQDLESSRKFMDQYRQLSHRVSIII